ncbi:hypothetical protein TSAR_009457 [Trichomalopsis sarcophagae]|uniref:Uncharacterized protein n=1 Tax=Trichomalopsis sarcophagae TaxID=543379 RepID=A0A232FMQ0_9HYME|nr:hypothetical protein TSAR_009457 [Trichomalopsis sarcophagae]
MCNLQVLDRAEFSVKRKWSGARVRMGQVYQGEFYESLRITRSEQYRYMTLNSGYFTTILEGLENSVTRHFFDVGTWFCMIRVVSRSYVQRKRVRRGAITAGPCHFYRRFQYKPIAVRPPDGLNCHLARESGRLRTTSRSGLLILRVVAGLGYEACAFRDLKKSNN